VRRSGLLGMLQTLVLPRREQLEPDCAVLARMLIVISYTDQHEISPNGDATSGWKGDVRSPLIFLYRR
jgi:hypothetical protein